MGIIAWIIVGGLAGWLASIVMGSNRQQGIVMDIILGIVGALVGGFILQALGLGGEVSGINIPSILTAFVGALIVLGIYRAVTGRRA
jgi:uncharacterized membrane protein YeaQ/YmgE (transglycosylase-associated protein family)